MTLPNFRFTTDHASPRTSCLASALCLSHLLNKLISSLLFVGRRSSKWWWLSSSAPATGLQAGNDELGHGIYISDIHTVVQFICQGRMSREKYRGKPCLIATVAQLISINGTIIVSIQPGCRIRWQSTLRAEIYRREVHMHNCVGRKCLGAKWNQLTIIKHMALPIFIEVRWLLVSKMLQQLHMQVIRNGATLHVSLATGVWWCTMLCDLECHISPALIKCKSIGCPSWLAKLKAKMPRFSKMLCWGQPMALQAKAELLYIAHEWPR